MVSSVHCVSRVILCQWATDQRQQAARLPAEEALIREPQADLGSVITTPEHSRQARPFYLHCPWICDKSFQALK